MPGSPDPPARPEPTSARGPGGGAAAEAANGGKVQELSANRRGARGGARLSLGPRGAEDRAVGAASASRSPPPAAVSALVLQTSVGWGGSNAHWDLAAG